MPFNTLNNLKTIVFVFFVNNYQNKLYNSINIYCRIILMNLNFKIKSLKIFIGGYLPIN